MNEDYRRFYENTDQDYRGIPQAQYGQDTYRQRYEGDYEPQPERQRYVIPESGKKSYAAHIVIALVLLVFVFVMQLIFGLFDVFFPEKVLKDGDIKGDKHYVSITPDELSPTGYRMMKGDSVAGNIYYCFVNGRCLFVVLPGSEAKGASTLKNHKLLGKVQEADSSVDSMLNKISGDLNLTSTSLSGTAYPFILSNMTANVVIDMAIAVLLVVTIFVAVALLIYGIVKQSVKMIQ
ncbi:MAG: hypothetical protein IK152_00050 [Lachnospiraceae bacterium]|nr:hypothetical protein [Lachnospiraceae bacterium]